MALFNKLFSTHKRKNVSASATTNKNAKRFPFSNEQVRILLYRECDWRGRRLLFDSTAIQKVQPDHQQQYNHIIAPMAPTSTGGSGDAKKHPSFIDTVDGVGYRYAKPTETDFNDIGEMVFGSVSMAVRATTLKVHWLPEPTRFLCSQVFVTPVPSGQAGGGRGSAGSGRLRRDLTAADASSMDTSSLNSFSLSVSVCVSERMDQLDGSAAQTSDEASLTHPLDVPQNGSTGNGVGGGVVGNGTGAPNGNGERNLAYSDSGYGGTDPWTSSGSSYYPYNSSTRSSFGSVFSDRGDSQAARKFSTDSSMTMEAAAAAVATGTCGGALQADGGLQRRILRNMTTSFENRKSQNDCVGFIGDQTGAAATSASVAGGTHLSVGRAAVAGGSEGCVTSSGRNGRRASEQVETHSNPEMIRRGRGVHSAGGTIAMRAGKRARLGLAICIQLSDTAEAEMQTFCAEHIILLESMLCRLRATAETAYANQKRFYQLMLRAWFATAEWFVDLFTAPRLVEPVWLALSGGYAQDAKQLAQGFMQELCWLLNCADTKDTNFFISTLLTAILTHHLGWVGTVAPITSDTSMGQFANGPSVANQLAREERAKMSEISRFHPYNVLWAQMSDLYGAIGSPPKVSKTVVCGTEEPLIGKVLNVLTYFIRCGQIERDIRAEVFEKQVIDDILDDFVSCTQAKQAETSFGRSDSQRSGRLTRTATCLSRLSDVDADEESAESASQLGRKNDIPNVLIFRDSRFVKQELRIGNFLMDTGIEMTGKQRQAIRDYRVKPPAKPTVMVTSPTMEELGTAGSDATSYAGTDDTVEEATETMTVRSLRSIYADEPRVNVSQLKTSPSLSDLITANSMGGPGAGAGVRLTTELGTGSNGAGAFLWGVEPIKEGVSEEQWLHIEKGAELQLKNGNCFSDGHSSSATGNTVIELKRTRSLFTKSTNAKNVDRIRRSKSRKNIAQLDDEGGESREEAATRLREMVTFDEANDGGGDFEEFVAAPLKSYPSLSDLITANSCGESERLTWGIEPVKESVTLDEVHHFESSQKRIDTNNTLRCDIVPSGSTSSAAATTSSGVVFVLGGDNETLVNLKSSSPRKSLPPPQAASSSTFASAQPPPALIKPPVAKKTCSHKKHSGVKFNFEKYPQIATNYMKNKNIDLAHYDFTADKALKLDNGALLGPSSSSAITTPADFPLSAAPTDSGDDSDSSECECCAGNATRTLLQTPSNATELEFSNDDQNYPTSTAASTTTCKQVVASSLSSGGGGGGGNGAATTSEARSSLLTTTSTMVNGSGPQTVQYPLPDAMNSIKLITLPMSKYQMVTTTSGPAAVGSAVATTTTNKSGSKTGDKTTTVTSQPAGFIPSLFVGITDHYVADMVLQGTTAPLAAWEHSLKQNLSLSAHCATLEPRITENVAILANTDQWDVKVVSSQTYVLPCGSGTSGPIGMSQLVATMLETVNAMWSAGLPAYQCMSYMESKLQELYLHSETLAAFLLATEFCSLSTVTSALNLSANDVPLLLSVASVHSPQVTKKYGVSFR